MRYSTDDIKVYMATHGPKCEIIPKYVTPIEVGANNRDNYYYELLDNRGENISSKNANYCELTALYWMWKNDTHYITGLYHYRRLFKLNEKQITRILKRYDVIASERIMQSCISEVINEVCPSGAWKLFLKYLKDEDNEYYEYAKKLLQGHKYYVCQMMVTTHKWLDEYCNWLFPMLDEFEKTVPQDMQDKRYIGYIAEIICLGMYLEKNHSRVYSVNVFFSINDRTIKRRVMNSNLYCSRFGNRIKVNIQNNLLKVNRKKAKKNQEMQELK